NDEHWRNLAAHLLRVRRRREAAPRHEQILDSNRKQGAIRVVVVTSTPDPVGEPAALEYVLFGQDILATQQARLAHAELRCGVDELRALEARQVLTYKIERGEDALARLVLDVRLVFDAQGVQVWDVRAIAPN